MGARWGEILEGSSVSGRRLLHQAVFARVEAQKLKLFRPSPAQQVADDLQTLALQEITNVNKHLKLEKELYRILFCDCKPFDGGSLNPILKKFVDYSKTETAKFRNELHAALKRKRKVALRLG